MTSFLYPDRYQLWLEHDLAKYRAEFYKDLRTKDQPAVWRFIESCYLTQYERLFRIEFEWSADGIWGIPFPGSVSVRGPYGPEDLNLPAALASQLQQWHRNIDENCDPFHSDTFDWVTSDQEGLAVAKRIKAHVGPSIYLEFNPFRELATVGGTVIELPVPDFVGLLNAAPHAV